MPGDQQQRPGHQQDDGIGQHQRDDRPDPGVLLVLGREADHDAEIDVQRRDDVHRQIADPVGREHQVRVAAEPHEQRDEHRREDRPFRHRAGKDQVDQEDHQNENDDVARRADRHGLQEVGKVRGQHRRDIGEAEEGDELSDDEQQEDQPGHPGEGLDDHADRGGQVLHGAGALAVAEADGEEERADLHDQPGHERRAGEDLAGLGMAQRRARRHQQQADDDDIGEQRPAGERRPRDCTGVSAACASTGTPPS